jgi:cytochrome c oxidase subunit 2
VNIHRYEKLWLAGALLLIVIFIATVTYGAVGVGIEMVSASGGTIAADSISDDARFADPRVEQVGENEYEAYVIAQRFLFRPSEIQVPANSRVTFYVTSPDVLHGFEVAGTNLNTMVIPGQITEVTVEFDEPATYGVVCSEYCGAAHHTMAGTLEVVPESEWEGGN